MPSPISWTILSSMAAPEGKSSLPTKTLMARRLSRSPMTGPEFPPMNMSMFSSDFTDSNTVATRRETVSDSAWLLPLPVFMVRGSKCMITRQVSSSLFGFQGRPASRGLATRRRDGKCQLWVKKATLRERPLLAQSGRSHIDGEFAEGMLVISDLCVHGFEDI